MTTHVIGSRRYPCGCGSHTNRKGLDAPGVYSRRCPRCGAHWVIHIDPSAIADRFPGLLKLTWGRS